MTVWSLAFDGSVSWICLFGQRVPARAITGRPVEYTRSDQSCVEQLPKGSAILALVHVEEQLPPTL